MNEFSSRLVLTIDQQVKMSVIYDYRDDEARVSERKFKVLARVMVRCCRFYFPSVSLTRCLVCP